jgi:mannose-6-phosphate isomerase-like protein (cupin superfamily)
MHSTVPGFSTNTSREEVFSAMADYINGMGFTAVKNDSTRPWGGFFVIDEHQAEQFIACYFPHLTLSEVSLSGKLSPKFLLVAPQTRLSWQYHHRRAEIWKLIGGTAGVITSDTDKEGDLKKLSVGDLVQLRQGERHRLIGLEGWGVVAEIWQHTDASHPSDEDDIVRVQDDFGR